MVPLNKMGRRGTGPNGRNERGTWLAWAGVENGAWAEKGWRLRDAGLPQRGKGRKGRVLAHRALPRWDRDMDRSMGWWSWTLS